MFKKLMFPPVCSARWDQESFVPLAAVGNKPFWVFHSNMKGSAAQGPALTSLSG